MWLIIRMLTSDGTPQQHLESLVGTLDDLGVTAYLNGVTRELWRANSERHEPDELFDDDATLGNTASRNLQNRVFHEVEVSRSVPCDLSAQQIHGATVLLIGPHSVRFVKAPQKMGRTIDLDGFQWGERPGRLQAAMRNTEKFSAHVKHFGMEPMLDVGERAGEAVGVDAFLVWGGDLESGATTASIGIPGVGSSPWLAVRPLWWDATPVAAASTTEVIRLPEERSILLPETVPDPAVKLKPGVGSRQQGKNA